jgi:dolichyl-phosphooligosaccharide-protein glycotransferase
VRGALILTCIVLVAWVRSLPLSLGVLDDEAEQNVRQQIRHRAEAKVSPDQPESAREAEIDRRVEEWIGGNTAEFRRQCTAEAARLKSPLRYEGEDGREHVYLGDFDSYVWLREARNYLRSGTTCDAIVNDDCRDTLTHAPVGRSNRYKRSLHVVAIVELHRLITRFSAGYPLAATAFLVPVIVGALGVLPSYAIGQRLAGDLGGISAAILIGLNPSFLQRSLGSDNDVWNIALPLCMVWAVSAALAAAQLRRQIVYAMAAAGFAALHAATWAGWVFTYAVVLFGLLANVLVGAFRSVIQRRHLRAWAVADVRRAAVVALVLYVTAALFTAIAGAGESALTLPFTLVDRFSGSAATGEASRAAPAVFWPNTFSTVGELAPPNLTVIAAHMGGQLLFFVSWLGLLILLLPRGRWHWWHFAVLIGGNYLYRYLLTAPDLSRITLIVLLALPMISATLLHLFVDDEAGDVGRGAEWIAVTWFLAALFLSYGGLRFVMLLAPPFGIAFAVAVGRLYDGLRTFTAGVMPSHAGVARIAMFPLVAAILILPVQQGYGTARAYLPPMNDAWWDTLTKLRAESPADAIVNTWWDYGYWTEYAAERRVSADGGSLSTHIPHWLATALLASTERESVGLLRMLNCGSDATPEPEGREGAYGKLLANGVDGIAAHSMIMELARLDRAQARQYLAQHDLSESAQADVLRSTHCAPPPSYLILTNRLTLAGGWRYLGSWDFRKAYVANRTRFLPEAVAVPDVMSRFGYAESDARSLYAQAAALDSEGAVRQFIGPGGGYVNTRWAPCQRDSAAEFVCPIGLPVDRRGTVLEEFIYHPDDPTKSRLRLADDPGGQGVLHQHDHEETPGVIVLANGERMNEMSFASPTYPDLAVLIDVSNARVLVGPPDLIRSTFTQLMYLDGRYAEFFEKVDERIGYGGEQVTRWKITWDGPRAGAGSPASHQDDPANANSAG